MTRAFRRFYDAAGKAADTIDELVADRRALKRTLIQCADKLETRGNAEPLEVAKILREQAGRL